VEENPEEIENETFAYLNLLEKDKGK